MPSNTRIWLAAGATDTHRESYIDVVMVAVLGALVALVAVIVLGTAFESF